jgi:hypothetical protein
MLYYVEVGTKKGIKKEELTAKLLLKVKYPNVINKSIYIYRLF